MQLKVLYHGNCFDGCASAALFTRFFTEREGARLSEVRYLPLQHQAGDAFPPDAFDGDANACVDFRFSASSSLHWWFDHHASAFPRPEDRAAFERDRSGQKFWDPTAPSCTGFIARILAQRFGWRAAESSTAAPDWHVGPAPTYKRYRPERRILKPTEKILSDLVRGERATA